MVPILMMSAKLAFLGLLKITVFRNKVYDVILLVHDVISRILSRESNFILDMFIRPKFGKASSPMREVIITSIL